MYFNHIYISLILFAYNFNRIIVFLISKSKEESRNITEDRSSFRFYFENDAKSIIMYSANGKFR